MRKSILFILCFSFLSLNCVDWLLDHQNDQKDKTKQLAEDAKN
jgi:hypothetical protein